MARTKKQNLLLVFVCVMLAVSILLPITTAFFSDVENIESNVVNVPHISLTVNQTVNGVTTALVEEDDAYALIGDASQSGENVTISVTVTSNIPVVLRVFVPSLTGEELSNFTYDDIYYYYNQKISASSGTTITLDPYNVLLDDEMIFVEAIQANEGGLINMFGLDKNASSEVFKILNPEQENN